MSYKENLLKKIRFDRLAQKALASLASPDDPNRLDKADMRVLLDAAGYRHVKERDLDLYLHSDGSEGGTILVLDNELPIYQTSVEDVAMRKSPTVKEMVNIRNAVKILNDKDVKISRKANSVRTVHEQAVAHLDLSYDESDLRQIEAEGMVGLESGGGDAVVESLTLFAEILGYLPAPAYLKISRCRIFGAPAVRPDGSEAFGPMVVYNLSANRLMLVRDDIGPAQVDKIKELERIVKTGDPAAIEGEAVFRFLRRQAVEKPGTDGS